MDTFALGGPSPGEIQDVATKNPAYVALGAIGPDIFFLLPDFKPPAGTLLWGAANTVRDVYQWWDDNFLGPYEDQIGPVSDDLSAELNSLSGGVVAEIDRITSRAFDFLKDTILQLAARHYDIFSLLSSGVPSGYDEQVFFWSDMLHYRKTYEFARYLWANASDPDPDKASAKQAFALGWMSHLATDVTGHSFVNEKCGGPYRLHWQRHHLIENHMDAKVYDSEYGTQRIYQMLSCAALHLWFAFKGDETSYANFFTDQPGKSYATGDDTRSILDRKSAWDVDSALPDFLADYLASALRDVYAVGDKDKPNGPAADHPTVISDLTTSDGYPTPKNIQTTYWWLSKYAKFITTDYFSIRRPEEPPIFPFASFPSPPGSGTSDAGPSDDDDNSWHDFLEILLAIFAWVAYLGEIVVWAVSQLVTILTGPATYPARQWLYEYIELPLYNAWAAMHWYLSITGFVYPMTTEINAGLTTLGVRVTEAWAGVLKDLNDLGGGLPSTPAPAGTEPVNAGATGEGFPIDVVVDPPDEFAHTVDGALPGKLCGGSETPSEYRRPWRWPDTDNEGDAVAIEHPEVFSGPYRAGQDATVLLSNLPGSQAARDDFAASKSEADTRSHAHAHLPLGEHLGGPVDYTCYLMARLTRDAPGDIANFNLDADRGYGYLCWDWVRCEGITASPKAFVGSPNGARTYEAPLRPGAGWCDEEIDDPAKAAALPPAQRPTKDDPTQISPREPVRIRYIDQEDKYHG
jgi:hypothetical protein